MNYRKIGNRIRTLRTERGLTQEELAFRINSSATYLSNIERGIKKPSLQKLVDIADILKVTLNDFIYEPTEETPKEDEMSILLSKYDPIKQEELKRNFADILHTLSTN